MMGKTLMKYVQYWNILQFTNLCKANIFTADIFILPTLQRSTTCCPFYRSYTNYKFNYCKLYKNEILKINFFSSYYKGIDEEYTCNMILHSEARWTSNGIFSQREYELKNELVNERQSTWRQKNKLCVKLCVLKSYSYLYKHILALE